MHEYNLISLTSYLNSRKEGRKLYLNNEKSNSALGSMKMRHILTFFLRMLVNGLSKDLGNLIEMFIIIRERILIILLKWSKIRITALEEVLSTMHSQSTAGCPFLIYTCRMQWRKNFRKNLRCRRDNTYQKEKN